MKSTTVYTSNTTPNIRDRFINAVSIVFVKTDDFLDMLDNMEYDNNRYDCFVNPNGETYIIDRKTGLYINWYKETHIGRDIYSTVDPKDFKKFLKEFKNSQDSEML